MPSEQRKPETAITPRRADDFAGWYQAVIKAADLAENAPVRGCMTIKPYGYALWENIVRIFDQQLKDYGVRNCAFPLLIPVSFLAKEAEHVEGFAKECAVVTHYRLEAGSEGGLHPAASSELEEPYVVRPTSETIIGEAMSRWVQSYRDLPLKLNQWGSVLRWEMRTRMFLRTSEFFWHEGHCAFADPESARQDCITIQDMYSAFFENYLAIPGIKGVKTPDERFPGAVETYSVETIMQDGKALQAATSHDLGQNFARSCGIRFQDRNGGETFAHTTSWAFSTRIIGALIMVHADDDGIVMPPKIAPEQIAIVPVLRGHERDGDVLAACAELATRVKKAGFRVQVDSSDDRMSDKVWSSIKRGVPLRIEIGARELDEQVLTYVRRDLGRGSRRSESIDEFLSGLPDLIDAMHSDMLRRATQFMDHNIVDAKSIGELVAHFSSKRNPGLVRIDRGLVANNTELESLKQQLGVTVRCIPFSDSGKTALVGRAY
jgi:prolyl-tRNA synthetase